MPIAATAIFAGLRRGEVCNLMWTQVDLERRFLWVEANGMNAGETWSPKTASSEAMVPIHPSLATVLSQVPKVTTAEGAPSVWVFPMLNGGERKGHRRAPDTTWFWRKTDEAAKAAGIDRHINFHGLRRTLGTLLRYGGHDVVTVQRALRHSSPVVSEKHYIGQDAQLLQQAIDSIDVPMQKQLN
jgi:integrase